jgi:putative MATE family efflux protein
MIRDLTQGSVARELITFSIPFALSNLLQTLYSLVDMVIIGQFVGSAGLSAVSIGGDVMTLLTFLCMGFCTAGQIMISQYVGSGDRRNISRTIGTMFTVILASSLVLAVVFGALATPLLQLLNTPDESWDQAMAYSLTCFVGLFFVYGYNTVSAILRGMGDAKRPMVFVALAAIMNLVLDLVFVAGLGLAAFGAALATVLSQAVSFIISIIYLYRRKESFGFDFKLRSFAVRKAQLLPLCKLGFPMALQYSAIMVSVMFVNAKINAFGVTISAVNGVGNKLRSLSTLVVQSVGTAASTMLGQNLGAKKHDRVSKIVHISLGLNVAYVALLSLVLLVFPTQVFRLFTSDAEVLAWAPSFMPVMVVTFLGSALMTPYNSLINGLGYASLSMVIGLLDGVVARISLSLALGAAFGVMGYWYGNAVAGFVTVILAAAYYYSGRWRTRKLLVE